MRYFNFDRIINKYGTEFMVITTNDGKYIGGVWQEGKSEEYNAFGAIMSLSQNKIYQAGGTITAQDRYLYMIKPIKEPLNKTKIKAQGNLYSIESNRDNGKEQFTGVYVYLLKWVSVFDKV